MPDIVHADAIRRIPVPRDESTPAKRDAAVLIEEMWPATLTEIAERSKYSRQHIKNALETHFEPAESGDSGGAGEKSIQQKVVEIDMATLVQVFRMAYQLGREDERKEQAGEELDIPDSEFADLMGVSK